ncbi:MAG TPA: tyrosinase family protein, partial [Longimicrobium sp.]|nr:tyrosinase family protein [Longimicrobium sp.]
GGVDTGFSHSGAVHGDLESQPHDQVHVLVGGGDPQNPNLPGLMSAPDTAGLDPIFYLHHANIDRLWQVWIQGPVAQGNPTDPNWVKGPAAVGQRGFAMPWPPNGTEWSYTPGDVENLATLDYTYDDLSPESVHPALASQLDTVAAAAAAPAAAGAPTVATPRKQNVELVGANDQPLRVVGTDEVRTPVRLDRPTAAKVATNLRAVAAAADAAPTVSPERVFLNLENVRGLADHTTFRVYVNVPEGANPADYPDHLAGNIALFGVRAATAEAEEHGGAGLTFVLEITRIVNALHLDGSLDTLDVRIVPTKPVPEEAQITIGRVSVYRQGE